MAHRLRPVQGKTPAFQFMVTDEEYAPGKYRTLRIEGTIRAAPKRAPHAGVGRSPFDHHGHLIADRFGGPGRADSGNIVPMHGYENGGAGQYGAMERLIKDALADQSAFMRVDVQYANPSEYRPFSFTVTVKYANGRSSTWKIDNFASYLRPK